MIALTMIPRHIKEKARQEQPQVERLSRDAYEVLCRQGHRHIVRFEFRVDDLYLGCDPLVCPSRKPYCYHQSSAAFAILRDHLSAGERVLVSEGSGPHWHTVTHVDEDYVYTDRVRDGFRRTFIVDFELASVRRAA